MTDTVSARAAVVSTTIPQQIDLVYRDILEELRANGYAVHLVTSRGPHTARLEARVHRIHTVPMQRQISLLSDVACFVAWLRLLRTIRPELVLAGSPKASLLALSAARLIGVRRRAYLLQGLRLEGTTGATRRLLAAAERLASGCADVVIAVSPSLAKLYQRLGLAGSTPVRVPAGGSSHGVDAAYFHPMAADESVRRGLGLDASVPTLCFIGRLTADKGLPTLAQGLRRLATEGLAVQLLVLGKQDERDSQGMLELLRGTGTLVRDVEHVPDVRPYLSLSDALVLPTRREGLPNVVLEAAAMQIPSITTDATGAVDSVVHGETGYVARMDDAADFAAGIRLLLTDQTIRRQMGVAARARAVEQFEPRAVARAIVGLAMGESAPVPGKHRSARPGSAAELLEQGQLKQHRTADAEVRAVPVRRLPAHIGVPSDRR
jgi:glycosyltransferase involved in cell wall biosynthesis